MKNPSHMNVVLCFALMALGVPTVVAVEDGWHRGDKGVGVQEIIRDWPLRQPDQPVLVAVMDSGYDTDHPRLAPAIWHNPAEAAGTAGADDDGNGFVDDVHGWSFLQSTDGEQLIQARMEVTRLYAIMSEEVAAGTRSEDDPEWKKVSRHFERSRRQWERRMLSAYMGMAAKEVAERDLEAAGVDPSQFNEVDPDSLTEPRARVAASILKDQQVAYMAGFFATAEEFLQYGYNPNFSESAVLADDPSDPSAQGYGGAQLSVGSRDKHGTMVAGVIGAVGDNDDPLAGISPWVKLVLVRSTPDGDERDKDVANGVRYAVACGARIINMSFGKPYSPQKDWVDAAMQEAADAGVLMVAAAGNDAVDIAEDIHYPSRDYSVDGVTKRFPNWLVVGASAYGDQIARFSNYGDEEVDFLAPGVDISAISADGGTDLADGTSFAAPVASGVAALLWSQFPDATVEQIRAAMLAGARPVEHKVTRPGGRKEVTLDQLVITGGVLDARRALAALAHAQGDESIIPEAWRYEQWATGGTADSEAATEAGQEATDPAQAVEASGQAGDPAEQAPELETVP